jgi:hypothetical protein
MMTTKIREVPTKVLLPTHVVSVGNAHSEHLNALAMVAVIAH